MKLVEPLRRTRNTEQQTSLSNQKDRHSTFAMHSHWLMRGRLKASGFWWWMTC